MTDFHPQPKSWRLVIDALERISEWKASQTAPSVDQSRGTK
jgi:hypothetical protein